MARATLIGISCGPSPVARPFSANAAVRNFSEADNLPCAELILPSVRRISAIHHLGSPLVSLRICNASEALACARANSSTLSAMLACKFKARASSPLSGARGSVLLLSPKRLDKSKLGPSTIFLHEETAPDENCKAFS